MKIYKSKRIINNQKSYLSSLFHKIEKEDKMKDNWNHIILAKLEIISKSMNVTYSSVIFIFLLILIKRKWNIFPYTDKVFNYWCMNLKEISYKYWNVENYSIDWKKNISIYMGEYRIIDFNGLWEWSTEYIKQDSPIIQSNITCSYGYMKL